MIPLLRENRGEGSEGVHLLEFGLRSLRSRHLTHFPRFCSFVFYAYFQVCDPKTKYTKTWFPNSFSGSYTQAES